jgi:hypothetical protein
VMSSTFSAAAVMASPHSCHRHLAYRPWLHHRWGPVCDSLYFRPWLHHRWGPVHGHRIRSLEPASRYTRDPGHLVLLGLHRVEHALDLQHHIFPRVACHNCRQFKDSLDGLAHHLDLAAFQLAATRKLCRKLLLFLCYQAFLDSVEVLAVLELLLWVLEAI